MKLLNPKTRTNWLRMYKKGSAVQRTSEQNYLEESTQNDALQQLYTIVKAAETEMKEGRTGTSTSYLVQVIQDPNTMILLDQIVSAEPELQAVIDSAEALAGMYKKGGCLKSKKKVVKKGAKGCKPCKQLMRVGGRLISVLTDCEGKIIKHATGGWIPKGQRGLTTNKVLGEKYRKAASGTGVEGDLHYWMDDEGKWHGQQWNAANNSWMDLPELLPNSEETMESKALAWARGQKQDDGTYTGGRSDFFVNNFDFNWDTNQGMFAGDTYEDRRRNAIAAFGQEEYDKGATAGGVIRGVQGQGGNDWIGLAAQDPTADDYIGQFGVRGAFNREAGRFRDALGTLRDQKRTLRREAFLTRRDNEAGNDYHMRDIRGSYSTAREGIRRDRANQMASLIDGTLNLWDQYSQNKSVYQAGSGRTGANGSYDNRIISNGQVGNAGRDRYDNTLIHNGTLNSEVGPLPESVLPANVAATQRQSSEMPEGYIDPKKGTITGFRSVDGDLEANVNGTWVDGSEVSDAQINAYRESERKRMMEGPSLSSKPAPLTNVPTTVQADGMNLSNAMSGYTPTNAEVRQRNRANAKEQRQAQRDMARDQRQAQRQAAREQRQGQRQERSQSRQAVVSSQSTPTQTLFTPELANNALTEMATRFSGKYTVKQSSPQNTKVIEKGGWLTKFN